MSLSFYVTNQQQQRTNLNHHFSYNDFNTLRIALQKYFNIGDDQLAQPSIRKMSTSQKAILPLLRASDVADTLTAEQCRNLQMVLTFVQLSPTLMDQLAVLEAVIAKVNTNEVLQWD